jgi:hypothetical protein
MIVLHQPCCSFEIEESGRFLKKATQKLLLRWAMGVVDGNAHGPEFIKFFCFFLFAKRSPSLRLR